MCWQKMFELLLFTFTQAEISGLHYFKSQHFAQNHKFPKQHYAKLVR